jgi:SAM-dependent methyltransferase
MSESTPLGTTDVPIPPQNLRFMGEDGPGVVTVGIHHADWLRKQGMPNDAKLLDVGSGYGRLAIGLVSSGYTGEYLGFDILRPHVRWCRQNLMPFTDNRLRFRLLDIRNSRYNPNGQIMAPEARFPAGNNSHDWAAVFSVFTHMYEADIRRYLSELERVMKPGGRVVATWFLFDEERLALATSPDTARFPMNNEINAVTRFTDPIDPLHAISYEQTHAVSMATDSGLEVEKVVRGHWCQDGGPEMQDFMLLRKPLRPPRRLVRRAVNKARRVSRRVLGR